MKKLFGLKDEKGNEIILNVACNEDSGKLAFYKVESESEPEFKVGQWGAYRNGDIFYLFLIHHFEGDSVYGQDFIDIDDIYAVDYQCDKRHLVSFPPAEIESHLRKICDQKYIGKKVKDVWNESIRKVGEFYAYYFDDDRLEYYDVNNAQYVIRPYRQGKFAEIIPDKKPLPKTRGEFAEFLDHFWDSFPDGIILVREPYIKEFINEYE